MVVTLLLAAMVAIMWLGFDRSGRRDVLFPSFTGGGFSGGKENPYMGNMCKIGAIVGIFYGLIAGAVTLLSAL